MAVAAAVAAEVEMEAEMEDTSVTKVAMEETSVEIVKKDGQV